MPKGQSAIEFMSGYGFVFLIIAIAIALLFIFSSVPATVLPTQCSFLSGFSCTDAIYTNTLRGSSLFISAIDTQAGIVNISSFSAYINFFPSNTGTCAPAVATSGQTVYCTANFTFRPKLGNIYSGSFKVSSNYCANAASNLSNGACPSAATYTYGGNVRVQASFFALGGTYMVPITMSNQQNSAIPAQSQVMVSFKPSTYQLYERSDLGNVRFYLGSKELYSWCETNCSSSSASNAIYWIKVPQAIPPASSPQNTVTIDMYLLPTSTAYDGIYAGEAPQLSKTYAQYDNGQNVFVSYFNGNTSTGYFTTGSGSSLSQVSGLGYGTGTITALALTTKALAASMVYTSGFAADKYVAESNLESTNPTADTISWAGFVDNATAANMKNGVGATTNCGGLVFGAGWVKGTGISCAASAYAPSASTWQYADLIYPGTGASTFTADIYSQLYSTPLATETATANPLSGLSTFYFGLITGEGGGTGQTIYFNWGRVRKYLPGNVMPSINFGSITKVG
ncbi:MAG: hypothetical protein KGH58_04090 [Candidatus Micrarchaeota archaeon]|nr:hypothetical protein [Candidatus Micrarchaeota archaeon]